jgi:redox-sensitive bicupin YhaK (pirin superfamily)
MVAGAGITHTECTPEDLRNGRVFTLHGYQIWIALPKSAEDMPPAFFHADTSELPRWEAGGVHYTLVGGKAFGEESPIPRYSDMFLLELQISEKSDLDLSQGVAGEIGIVVVSGAVRACGSEIPVGSILYSKPGESCLISCEAGAHLLVFGGEPLEGERFITWNFVSSDRSKIEVARRRWEEKTFPMMEGEPSYIPMPVPR